jgi:hypothetical protein
MDHIQLHMSFKEEGYIGERRTHRFVSGFHCKDGECVGRFKKAKFSKCCFISIILVGFLVGLGIVWAYPSDVYVWQI